MEGFWLMSINISNTCWVLLLLLTVLMYTTLSTTKYHNIPYIVAIVDCTHVGPAIASFKDSCNNAQENTTNQTADVLVKDQLQSPLDSERVGQERELHKPNSRTKHRLF